MSELESNLPKIETLILSPAELQAKLEELESHASEISIQVKGGGQTMAETEVMDVRAVGQTLSRCKSVQIRYVREGVRWSDTFSTTAQGIQLIHFQLP